MAKRTVISTPPGTTAVLFKKNAYKVGDEVPDDFPAEKLAYVDAAADAGVKASTEDSGTGKKKRGGKAKAAK